MVRVLVPPEDPAVAAKIKEVSGGFVATELSGKLRNKCIRRTILWSINTLVLLFRMDKHTLDVHPSLSPDVGIPGVS